MVEKVRANKGAETAAQVLSRDRHFYYSYCNKAKKPKNFDERIEKSRQIYQRRKASVPTLNYDERLPVARHVEAIKNAIAEHQIIILCGDTGSGKSTQLPKICLEAGRGIAGFIGHTQPRRIAARSVANRIAEEIGSTYLKAVGYRTRFDEKTDDENYIRLLTDGMLLAEMANDHFLSQYDTLIIDEAHERSLNIDFLVGYLKRLLPKRPDLKLIITSATIDPERFSRHFNNAPIINVEGRTYPVEVRYRPIEDDDEEQHYLNIIKEVVDRRDGDVLVFLPGEAQIRELEKAVSRDPRIKAEVVPLYGRLSPSQQQSVFQTSKSGAIRVVLATNVAETSITVPGIRYVVDSGLARVQRFSDTHQIKQLPIEAIARANADQRKGRCGRVAEGICYRLYSEEDFEARPEFLEPEILRTSLAQVILTMSYLRLGEAEHFPFIDSPKSAAIREARKLLAELGAYDKHKQLTKIGRELAKMPIDPRVGRVVLESKGRRCLYDGLVLAAFLSCQDPRIITSENREAARQKHAELITEKTSEVWQIILLWRRLNEEQKSLSRNVFNTFCEKHHIASRRFKEWQEVFRQLRDMVDRAKKVKLSPIDQPEALYQSLLSGFLGNVAQQYDGREYRGTRNKGIFVPHGTRAKDKWIVAAELVQTSRLFARMIAPIDPEWIIEEAGNQIVRSYSDSHWAKKEGVVMAYEKCTFQGLIVRAHKKISYGPINQDESRTIFIQEALVGEALKGDYPFVRQNRLFLEEYEDLERRTRRIDMRIDELALYDFFDARLPSDMWSESRLSAWLQKQPKEVLVFSESEFTPVTQSDEIASAYPQKATLGIRQTEIDYEFAPGSQSDGASFDINIVDLNQIEASEVDWSVPGLISDRVVALLRSLPKAKRKLFVPVTNTADAFMREVNSRNALLSALVRYLNDERPSAQIALSDFDLDRVDTHLLPLVRILDSDGKLLDSGRDFYALKEKWAKTAHTKFAREGWNFDQQFDVDSFDFPVAQTITKGAREYIGYLALTYEKNTFSVRAFDGESFADEQHQLGLTELIKKEVKELAQIQKRYRKELEKMALAYSSISTYEELVAGIDTLVINEVFFENTPLPRSSIAFKEWVSKGLVQLALAYRRAIRSVEEIVGLYQSNSAQIDIFDKKGREVGVTNMRAHLNSLVFKGFLSHTPVVMVVEMPRYLKALSLRISRAESDYSKDQQKMRVLQPYEGQIEKDMSDQYRMALEEFRVATYAPELGTKFKVSEKLLRALLDDNNQEGR